MKHYTKDHEWIEQVADQQAWRLGITAFAQEQLGDVVNIELPEVGTELAAGGACAVIESVKSASDINSPIAGKVSAVNSAVAEDPELVNKSAEGDAWLFEITVDASPDTSSLMDKDKYLSECTD